jgi:hypothetical protein
MEPIDTMNAISRKEHGVAFEVAVENLNHLGIVAQMCREIGVAKWLDAQDSTSRQQVSVGTATVAMVLNGLGLWYSPKPGSSLFLVNVERLVWVW